MHRQVVKSDPPITPLSASTIQGWDEAGPSPRARPPDMAHGRLRSQGLPWLRLVCGALILFLFAVLLLLARELWLAALPAWREGVAALLLGQVWDPAAGRFGALPLVMGTVLTSGLALVLAFPVALGTAVFVSEYAPEPIRGGLSAGLDAMAAVPALVFGLWGLLVLLPWAQLRLSALPVSDGGGALALLDPSGVGFTLLGTGVVLALMTIPTTASLAHHALAAVPRAGREAGLALGCTRWEVLRYVVLAQARTGLWAAIVLGLGRALGESLVVAMTLGGTLAPALERLPSGATLTSVVLRESGIAGHELHLASLAALILLIVALSLALAIGGRLGVQKVVGRLEP